MAGTGAKGRLEIEMSQISYDNEAMSTNDKQTFKSLNKIWSNSSGLKPDVKLDGKITGVKSVSVKSGANDTVSVKTFTAYINGIIVSATPADIAMTRPTTGFRKNSIVMADDGTLSEVGGTDNTAFSDTRGAAGGAPLIPVDSIEVAQVWFTSTSSADVLSSEIKQDTPTYTERSDSPIIEEVHNYGYGLDAETPDEITAFVKFSSALDDRHDGSITRKVYIDYSTPEFVWLPDAAAFKGGYETQSKVTESVYGAVRSAPGGKDMTDGSFTSLVENGATDTLMRLNGKECITKFWPDEEETAYLLNIGSVSIDKEYPSDGMYKATVAMITTLKESMFDA